MINQIIGSGEQQQTEPSANGEWNTAKVTVYNPIVTHSEEPCSRKNLHPPVLGNMDEREKIENCSTFHPKNCHQALKKMGLGTEIRDPEKDFLRIPDPGIKKVSDLGS